jgi:mono/diheme cytochrome c family protein
VVEKTEVALRAFGDTMTNPLPVSEATVARGQAVYDIYCTVCHGPQGQGDGPIVGPGKFPFALNLTLPQAVARSDGYLYAIVKAGRGLMPSYQRIPPADRWAVVNYVRHLQQGGAEPTQAQGQE